MGEVPDESDGEEEQTNCLYDIEDHIIILRVRGLIDILSDVIYSFVYMRTIKTNVNSLEKNQYDIEAYAYQTQAKKKSTPESKSPYDKPERTIQHDPPTHLYAPHDTIIENTKEL